MRSECLNLPFPPNTFDVVACYEVLEHLSFKYFPDALRILSSVSRSFIIISLPDSERNYRYLIELPQMTEIR